MTQAAEQKVPRTSATALIDQHLIDTQTKSFNENQWGRRHVVAWKTPLLKELAIRKSIEGLALMADAHALAYESPIGNDGFLGPAWRDQVRGMLALLNGDCGRYDCGTLDALLRDIAKAGGIDDLE